MPNRHKGSPRATGGQLRPIGAQTADQAWLYNQIAANLNGLLIVAFALGLWRALGSGWLARFGVLGLAVIGVTRFLEGLPPARLPRHG